MGTLSTFTNGFSAMQSPEPARTTEILAKRVERLLHLESRGHDQSELAVRVMPFLKSLGSLALIGGAIRDVARVGKRGFTSDLDFVVYGSSRARFLSGVEARQAKRNKFGGFGLECFGVKVDVWHIDDTWARTAGLVDVREPVDLLQCTFFDWDSVIYDVALRKLIHPPDYLQRLQSNVMDIRLEENPNPAGSLIRALRRAALWGVQFGPRLTAFSKKHLRQMNWDDLVAIDGRAFSKPVLKHLDRKRLLEQLDSPLSAERNTLPVSEKLSFQLSLPLSKN